MDRARTAAFCITNAEGAALHLHDLQRVRHWFARQVAQLRACRFAAGPGHPCTAPVIGTDWIEINGNRMPARASRATALESAAATCAKAGQAAVVGQPATSMLSLTA